MPFQQPDLIRYYTFDLLAESGVKHAVFTRQGGASPTPWDSLNVGGTVGDNTERVIENRKRSFRALACPPESIFDVWQVHGNDVICAQSPRGSQAGYQKADAILTDRSQVTLFMRFADCVPILLYDPRRQVVGLVHAGWQGTIKKVAVSAVNAMVDCYGSTPAEILAGIGPSICANHYEVGPEVVDQVRKTFGTDLSEMLITTNEGNGRPEARHAGSQSGVQFDLWSANRLLLENAGVQYIEESGICTACSLTDWYSHRAEKGLTGRFGALITL